VRKRSVAGGRYSATTVVWMAAKRNEPGNGKRKGPLVAPGLVVAFVVGLAGAAFAQAGGDGAGNPGSGGASNSTTAGTNGGTPVGAGLGGGGGGAGLVGGVGGAGTAGSIAGGTSGTSGGAGSSGGNGGSGGVGGTAGGGGGGGGGHGAVVAGGSNAGTIAGGSGGNGGNSGTGGGAGGGGGGGGYGVVVTGASYSNSGTIAAGAGGAGGSGFLTGSIGGGNGGDGGFGVQVTASGASFTNSNTVTGGNGGGAGGGVGGSSGAGGAGIVGSGLTVINSGAIAGGTGGGAQANAITFTGGANTLTLQGTSWTLTGNIRIDGGGSLTFNQTAAQTLDNVIAGNGSINQNGPGRLTLTGLNTYTGATTINAGTLALSGSADISSSSLVTVGAGATFNVADNFATQINALAGSGTVQLGSSAGMEIVNASGEFSGVITSDACGCSTLAIGGGTQTLSGVNTYVGITALASGATLALKGSGSIASSVGVQFFAVGPGVATFDISQTTSGAVVGGLADVDGVGVVSLGSKTLTVGPNGGPFAGVILDGGIGGGIGGGLTIASPDFGLQLAGVNTYTGATTVLANGVLAVVGSGSIASSSGVTLAGVGALFDISGSDISQTIKDLSGVAGTTVALGGNALTVGTANSTSFAGTIVDGGLYGGTGASLVKTGSGTLTLTGANTYTGGTTVNGGLINFSALGNFGTGMVTLNGGGVQWAAGTATDISSRLAPLGAGGATFDTNGNNVTFATGLTGTGGLAKQGLGTLNLTGNNSYTGPTTINGGTLSVNGSLAGSVTVNSGGMIGGNGTVGGLVSNGGTFAPGNSIGTLNVNGNLVQNGGTYQVEANAAGQSDKINVSGTAAINGGTVQVLAQPGVYAANTTYTILSAGGGVAGAYSSVTSNFAFLTPSLAYTANNVLLTLSLAQNAFSSFGGNTPNQRAVGVALDQSFPTSSGDFNTVLNAIAVLSTTQGPAALTAISGQPWADFGTMNVNNAAMFMNALGQQMAGFHGGQPAGQRLALAQACEVESCDGVGPLSAWASALGGLGSVLGDSNASTLTYNLGGAAAGLDYRFDPRFLLGIGTGYTHGTQWVNSFMGQGWSDSVSVAAYGSFTQWGFYADALAGYAYSNNQLQRQILIPGLQQRTATGSTGANQFLGQVEAGYKVGIYAPAAATITPFGRFQISSVTQNAFSESGAQSLSLNVAQQTTNSQRTTIGADLGSSIGIGNDKKLDVAVRLGWQHEFADTGRPITAAFAGAPGNSFTVFGATPARDSAIVGLQASTNIAQATQVYLRYDGGVGGGTDNHALNVGLRMSW
jgi:outer membrane autotransporter protein